MRTPSSAYARDGARALRRLVVGVRVHGQHAERVPGAVDRAFCIAELAGGCHHPRRYRPATTGRVTAPGVPSRDRFGALLAVAVLARRTRVLRASSDARRGRRRPAIWRPQATTARCSGSAATRRLPVRDRCPSPSTTRSPVARRSTSPSLGAGRTIPAGAPRLRSSSTSAGPGDAGTETLAPRPTTSRRGPPAVRPRLLRPPRHSVAHARSTASTTPPPTGVVRGPAPPTPTRSCTSFYDGSAFPSTSSPTASTATARGSRGSAAATSPATSIGSAPRSATTG